MKKRMIQTEFAEHVDQTFKHWNKADNGELEFDVPSLPSRVCHFEKKFF